MLIGANASSTIGSGSLVNAMRAKAKPDGPISITRYAKVEATAVPPVGLRPFKINDFSVRANCAQ